MDTKLDRYRDLIGEVLQVYARWSTSDGVTGEIISDRVRDHYEVLCLGWDGVRRIHNVVVHLDIIDGKVWVQHDSTDRPVAEMLVEMGIPKEDIVLGFYSPRKRAMTGYAVA